MPVVSPHFTPSVYLSRMRPPSRLVFYSGCIQQQAYTHSMCTVLLAVLFWDIFSSCFRNALLYSCIIDSSQCSVALCPSLAPTVCVGSHAPGGTRGWAWRINKTHCASPTHAAGSARQTGTEGSWGHAVLCHLPT